MRVDMDHLYQILPLASGAFVAFALYLIQRVNIRMDKMQHELTLVQVNIAKAQQENVELHTHIRRIDKNINSLFKKVEELLVAVQKNGNK